MTADPRAALTILVTALERHLEVASSHQDPDDPSVIAAAQDLADAFDEYDEALFRSTEVATPLAIYDGPFDDEDEDDDEDDEDDDDEDDEDDEDDDDEDEDVADVLDVHEDEDRSSGVYAGLDDEDIEFDDEGDPTAPGVNGATPKA